MLLRRSAWLFLTSLSVACGSDPAAPPQAPSVPAPASTPEVAVRALPPPDLGAVDDPEGLVVVGKVSKLRETMATLAAWTGKSISPNDALNSVIADDAAPFVDTGAPIDFAVLVSPSGFQLRPRTAVSVALRDPSADGVRLSERFKLVPQGNGVSLIQSNGSHPKDSDGDDESDLDTCEIAPAFGPVSTRLVCASNAKALAELGPWLTRTATRVATTADVSVNVRLQSFRSIMKLGRGIASSYLHSEVQRRIGDLPILKELGRTVIDDLVDFAIDLDTATIELGTADSQLSLSAALKFSGHQSTLTRLLTSHPERTAPAPAAFWQLPADANAAFFSRGTDESDIAHLRSVLADVIRSGLAKDASIKDAEQKLFIDAVGKLMSPAASSWATGFDDGVLSAAATSAKTTGLKSTQQQRDAAEASMLEARLGWMVGEVESPVTEVTGRIKDIGVDLDRIAATVASRPNSVANSVPMLRAAPLPKGISWPASAQHFVLTIPTSGVPGTRVLGRAPSFHVVVVPDGVRTWLAVDSHVESLSKRLADTMAGKGKNLGSLSELGAFRSEVGSGGFYTLRIADGLFGRHDALPHQGRVPVPYSITSQSGGDGVVMTVRVPKGAIEDQAADFGRWQLP